MIFPKSIPFLVFQRDHLRSKSAGDHLRFGIISGLGIICGRGSFPVWGSLAVGDHLRSGIISGLGIICGRGSFPVWGSFAVGDHLRSNLGISCGRGSFPVWGSFAVGDHLRSNLGISRGRGSFAALYSLYNFVRGFARICKRMGLHRRGLIKGTKIRFAMSCSKAD